MQDSKDHKRRTITEKAIAVVFRTALEFVPFYETRELNTSAGSDQKKLEYREGDFLRCHSPTELCPHKMAGDGQNATSHFKKTIDGKPRWDCILESSRYLYFVHPLQFKTVSEEGYSMTGN